MSNYYAWIMVGSSFLAAFSQILLKKSTKKSYKHPIYEYLNIYVFSGYAILLSTMIINIYAYTGIDYKLGPILTSTSYIFVLLLSKLMLKEKITIRKLIGISSIIFGIILFNL